MATMTTVPTDTTTTTYPALGGCACERVRYELVQAPLATWLCHCLTCRKFSGSLFMGNSFTKKEYFRITKGQDNLRQYNDAQSLDAACAAKANANDAGAMVGYFCATCHCLVYTGGGMMGDTEVVIPSGTYDEPLQWRPTMEFWCKRRSPWLPSFGTPADKMFDENPPN